MDRLMMLAGRVGGLLGLLLCTVAAGGRLAGLYWIGGFQLATLMQAGIAAMVAGCFLMLFAMNLRVGGER